LKDQVLRSPLEPKPTPSDPGFRGRGLTLMRGLAHEVDIRTGQDGTTVLMVWSLPADRD
jgi:anti-sigma regulatory factor (Ser/Thr protein kinase)